MVLFEQIWVLQNLANSHFCSDTWTLNNLYFFCTLKLKKGKKKHFKNAVCFIRAENIFASPATDNTLFQIDGPPATAKVLQLHVRSHVWGPWRCHHSEHLGHLRGIDVGQPELLQHLRELFLCSAWRRAQVLDKLCQVVLSLKSKLHTFQAKILADQFHTA